MADDSVVWDDDPPGFEELLSQELDRIESSQSCSQPEGLTQSETTTVTVKSSDEASGASAEDCHSDNTSSNSQKSVLCPEKDDEEKDEVIEEPPKQAEVSVIDHKAEADAISRTGCVVDDRLQDIDPKPDITHLFRLFDERFFDGKLVQHKVKIRWSDHMTLCAGLCEYFPKNKVCVIKMSKPLVSQAPRKDLVQTLLHEMIHAHLFLTGQDDDRSEHGPQFTNHMARINTKGHCRITLQHTFAIVWHIWTCRGPCSKKPPRFGIVKRSSNRPPNPTDEWFDQHLLSCGGEFVKTGGPDIKRPANVPPESRVRKQKGKSKNDPPAGSQLITTFFNTVKKAVPAVMKSSPKSTHSPKGKVNQNQKARSTDKETIKQADPATAQEVVVVE